MVLITKGAFEGRFGKNVTPMSAYGNVDNRTFTVRVQLVDDSGTIELPLDAIMDIGDFDTIDTAEIGATITISGVKYTIESISESRVINKHIKALWPETLRLRRTSDNKAALVPFNSKTMAVGKVYTYKY